MTKEEFELDKVFVGEGWHGILDWLFEQLTPEVKLFQVKEKFGGLRFYIESDDDKDHEFVTFVERMSYHVCEMCGTTLNVTTEGGWLKTLCGDCRDEQGTT